MEVLKYKENIIKFSIYTIILLLIMLVISKVFYKETPKTVYNDITTSVIEHKDENTNIYVEYPRFYTNEEINTVVNETLLNYI